MLVDHPFKDVFLDFLDAKVFQDDERTLAFGHTPNNDDLYRKEGTALRRLLAFFWIEGVKAGKNGTADLSAVGDTEAFIDGLLEKTSC